MSEKHINRLSEFRVWRAHFLPDISSALQMMAGTIESISGSLEALRYYQALLAMPVSKLSKFGDPVWDFNADAPHAARNVKGKKLAIDFTKFKNINVTGLLEVKASLYFYLLAPAAVAGERLRGKKTVKYNTAIYNFEGGLRFINHLYGLAAEELGEIFIAKTCFSLTQFSPGMYAQAAETFPYKYNPGIARFFSILRSRLLRKCIFGDSLGYVRIETLPWCSTDLEDCLLESRQESSTNHLPNDVFEKLSNHASLLIVDFLEALNLPIQDADSLKRRNAKGFRHSDQFGITPRLMELYTAMRLGAQGYSLSSIEQILGGIPEGASSCSALAARDTIEKLSGGLIHDGLRQYLNLVNYSCCYIVGQYTGMRPSELSELLVDSCLEQDGPYWLLKSRVVKHEQEDRKLFDDKWLAIPIVRDAIEAARVLARYKQNPYLFSSVFTIAPGANCIALDSAGMKYQLDALFSIALSQDQYEALDFSPYILRHTLAFQMYRVDLGLPFISHQLKHFGEIVGGYGKRGVSKVTLGYGNIGDMISKGGRHVAKPLRREAEIEAIKDYFDPDGGYAGVNAAEHKARNDQLFKGYMAAGYSKDQIFEAMAEQHLAIVNVGMGFCYGGAKEEFDDSLPCIGSLRCNPNRCSNSVITKAHAPKWREIYAQNKMLLLDPRYADRREQIEEVMTEAEGVLKYLGEEVEL